MISFLKKTGVSQSERDREALFQGMCRIGDNLLEIARNDDSFFEGEEVSWRITKEYTGLGTASPRWVYGLQANYKDYWVCFSTNNHDGSYSSRSGAEGILWFLKQVRGGLAGRIQERVRAYDQAITEQNERDQAAIPEALEILALLEHETLQRETLIRAA